MKIKSIIVISIMCIMLLGCGSHKHSKVQYVIETSNALEKNGIIIQKNEWLFNEQPIRVIDSITHEIVVYKGYNLHNTSNNTFMLYGIIESDNNPETYILMRFDKSQYKWEYI